MKKNLIFLSILSLIGIANPLMGMYPTTSSDPSSVPSETLLGTGSSYYENIPRAPDLGTAPPPPRYQATHPYEVDEPSWIKQHPLITTASAGLIAAATALYAGLRWYQRNRIKRTLRNHDLNLTKLNPLQKGALAAAINASYRVPRSLRKIAVLSQQPDFASDQVPEQTMWQMIAELYYRTKPTDMQVEKLKEQIGLYRQVEQLKAQIRL